MGWANLDDRLHAHPKVRRLRRQGAAGLEAFGLWAWALTWCRAYEPEEAWLPGVDDLADEWNLESPRADELLRLLVRVRLVDEVEAEEGLRYRIHDWQFWQFTAQKRGGKARARTAKRAADGTFAESSSTSSLVDLDNAGAPAGYTPPHPTSPNHTPPARGRVLDGAASPAPEDSEFQRRVRRPPN